jgi:hypothetical protein
MMEVPSYTVIQEATGSNTAGGRTVYYFYHDRIKDSATYTSTRVSPANFDKNYFNFKILSILDTLLLIIDLPIYAATPPPH